MNRNELKSSKYLRKEDFERPALLTVASIEEIDIAQPGEAPQKKGAMYFKERSKPLVLNDTNNDLAAEMFKSDECDDWVGKQCVVYVDPSVVYQGKKIGGLRLRAPLKAPGRKVPEPVIEDEDINI